MLPDIDGQISAMHKQSEIISQHESYRKSNLTDRPGQGSSKRATALTLLKDQDLE